MGIEILQITGLAKRIDTKGIDTMPSDRAEPAERG